MSSILFDDLGLHPDILKGIREKGFERPTPVQAEAIPPILAGRDVIATAQTGTGKTAAFVLPILHRFLSKPPIKKGVRALIVAPTRELALQSTQQLESLSRYVPLRGAAIFGGVPMQPQVSALAQGVDIISATPGRLLDHVYEGRIDFGALETLVLDEADRMMDMGFLPDIERIISLLPPKRQNLIFSATIPPDIMKLAHKMCHDPVMVQIGRPSTAAAGIRQAVYPVAREQKTELIARLIRDMDVENTSVLVFVRMKTGADRLSHSLERAGIRTAVIHSNRSQGQRLMALERFKSGRIHVLVATDIAARGIDVKDISHVINYDVPQTPEDYIHRIGRTARAEATGDAFTLFSPDEEKMITEIEQGTHQTLPRVTLPDFAYRAGGHSAPRSSHDRSSHGPQHSRPQHRDRGPQQHSRPHSPAPAQSPKPPVQAQEVPKPLGTSPRPEQHRPEHRPMRPDQKQPRPEQHRREPEPRQPEHSEEPRDPSKPNFETEGHVKRGPAPELFYSSDGSHKRRRGRSRH